MPASTPFIIYSAYSFLLRYQKQLNITKHDTGQIPNLTPNSLVDHLMQNIFYKEAQTNKVALQDAVYASVHEFKDVDRELFQFYIDGWSTSKILDLEIKMLTYIHETLTRTAATHEDIEHLIMIMKVSKTFAYHHQHMYAAYYNQSMYFKFFCTSEASIFLSIYRGLINFKVLPPLSKTHPTYVLSVTTTLCQSFCDIDIPNEIANDKRIMSLVALQKGGVAFRHCGDLLVQDKSFFLKVIVRHYPYWLDSFNLNLEKYKSHLADKKIIMQTLLNMKGCPFQIETMKRIHPTLLDDEDVVKLILSIEPKHIAIINPRLKEINQ